MFRLVLVIFGRNGLIDARGERGGAAFADSERRVTPRGPKRDYEVGTFTENTRSDRL